MDPRLRSILLQLLQLAVEQEMTAAQDPLMQPPPDRPDTKFPVGSLGYNLREMAAMSSPGHSTWPAAFEQVTDFGPA